MLVLAVAASLVITGARLVRTLPAQRYVAPQAPLGPMTPTFRH